MKLYRKITAAVCAAVLTAVSLSSCGYELVLKKKDNIDSTENTSGEIGGYVETTSEYVPTVTQNPNFENETVQGGATDESDSSYKALPMSSQDVLELYTRAMNDVKIRAPGYVRYEYQEVSDVEAGDGNMQLMNNILNLVCTELLKDSGDEAASIEIMAHDDIAVRDTFPLYDKDVGCELTNMAIIKSAVCYTDGKSYKIVISFDDQLNPDHEDSDFAKIMTPIDRDSLSDPIEEYLVVLDKNKYQFDINYTNCEIVCTIDKATSRMTSLSHKMIMDIDINMNLDLILFQTNSVKASGRIVNILKYSDFDWTT